MVIPFTQEIAESVLAEGHFIKWGSNVGLS